MSIHHPLKFSHEDYRPKMTDDDVRFIAGKFGAAEHVDMIEAYRELADPQWEDDPKQKYQTAPADVSTLLKHRKEMADEAVLVVDILELIEHATTKANAERQYKEMRNLGYLALSGPERKRYEAMLGKPSEAAHFIGWFRSVSGDFFSHSDAKTGPQKVGLDMGGNKQMGNWGQGRDTHALANSLPEQVDVLYGGMCRIQILDPTPKFRYEAYHFPLDSGFERHPLTQGVATVQRRIPLANMHFEPGGVKLAVEEDAADDMDQSDREVDIPVQTVRLYMPSQALILPGLIQERRHREYLLRVPPIRHGATKEDYDAKAGEIAGHYFQDGIVRLRGQSNNVLPIDSRIITMAIRPNADVPL